MEWTVNSWQSRTAIQQPVYVDHHALQDVIARLSKLPPLVTSWEIESLKSQLADAAEGRSFLLQGGDCSERIDECSTESIVRQLKVLIQMSLVLEYAARRPVVRVGRIAGQYAKPRSTELETRGDMTLPVYRGDIINRSGFTEDERKPDAELLIRGYERAALTLNFIRALSGGGFADLHHPENWDLEFARKSPQFKKYSETVGTITHALQFLETILERSPVSSKGVEFFTSHEGLHLFYEQAQTRRVPRRKGWYNLGTHFPWIGNRTRDIAGAHVEYFRGIRNPIGLKIDAALEPKELIDIIRYLNPENEKGRMTLIHRMGAEKIAQGLPRLVEAVQREQLSVLWCADPMHGNTFVTQTGTKTRDFDQILKELTLAFDVHKSQGSILGGVHLELTGDDVTECIGGSNRLTESDLSKNYRSAVDPRLNYDQAMEIAFAIADQIGR